jgi:hypothetical protein
LSQRLQQVDGRSEPAGFPDRRSERASCECERALYIDDRRLEGLL